MPESVKTVIRDRRSKQMYRIDDLFYDEYAKKIGIHAVGVYNAMCRHANSDDTCFPSEEMIAERLGISRNTVVRAVKSLKDWGIITFTQKKRKKDKKFLRNTYTLVSKNLWKKDPCPSQSHGMAKPCTCGGHGPCTCGGHGLSKAVHLWDTLRVHSKKGITYKKGNTVPPIAPQGAMGENRSDFANPPDESSLSQAIPKKDSPLPQDPPLPASDSPEDVFHHFTSCGLSPNLTPSPSTLRVCRSISRLHGWRETVTAYSEAFFSGRADKWTNLTTPAKMLDNWQYLLQKLSSGESCAPKKPKDSICATV